MQSHVKNLSAYWIPELTVTEVIHGTLYTVTGSYEGTGSFLRKLERIAAKIFWRTGVKARDNTGMLCYHRTNQSCTGGCSTEGGK